MININLLLLIFIVLVIAFFIYLFMRGPAHSRGDYNHNLVTPDFLETPVHEQLDMEAFFQRAAHELLDYEMREIFERVGRDEIIKEKKEV
ncbi:MAG: hypothetical protein HXS54_06215 [Theionarchaea archaeon]|nr:hypothetical protein [Theionarchaea archaeon]DBA34853.1 TPA_asm: hypothetical protein vir521_00059 [Caudoviricetes sp. vir521]